MLEILNGFLKQLNPTTGIIIILLISAVIALWRYHVTSTTTHKQELKDKDDEIERLRLERNTAVEKKDVDLKEVYNKFIEMSEKNVETGEKVANNVAANTDMTKRVEQTLRDFSTVLINIKK